MISICLDNMSINMKNTPLINGDNTFFVHFSSIQECSVFKNTFTGILGHTCCNGKGVHVKTYKGKTVNNDQIYDIIRKEYKTK
jgi:hypothetical protein